MATQREQRHIRAQRPKEEPGPVAKFFGGLIVIGVLVGVVLLVVALAGGGASDTAGPSAAAPAAPSSALSPDDLYLATLRAVGVQVTDKQSMVAGARLTRAAFDRGETMRDFARGVVSQGIKPETAGKIIGAAVNAYCPEHRDKLSG